MSVIDLWWRWRTFSAMPFTGGWAQQPAHLMEAIETAHAAYKIYEHEQQQKAIRSK